MVSPVVSCLVPGCPAGNTPLGGQNNPWKGVLFTRARGVLPIIIYKLYCRSQWYLPSSRILLIVSTGCKTTYRPNYYITNASNDESERVYSLEVPQYLEITQHSYIERELVAVFRHQMAFTQYVHSTPRGFFHSFIDSSTSASGDSIARIYNTTIPPAITQAASLTTELVWHAFWLCSLLQHAERIGQPLRVPHRVHQDTRWSNALDARNRFTVGTGQPLWAHACDDCEKIIFTEDAAGGPPVPTSEFHSARLPFLCF